jgi:hypothetical protein
MENIPFGAPEPPRLRMSVGFRGVALTGDTTFFFFFFVASAVVDFLGNSIAPVRRRVCSPGQNQHWAQAIMLAKSNEPPGELGPRAASWRIVPL